MIDYFDWPQRGKILFRIDGMRPCMLCDTCHAKETVLQFIVAGRMDGKLWEGHMCYGCVKDLCRQTGKRVGLYTVYHKETESYMCIDDYVAGPRIHYTSHW